MKISTTCFFNQKLTLLIGILFCFHSARTQVGGAGGILIEVDQDIKISDEYDLDYQYTDTSDILILRNEIGEKIKSIILPAATLAPLLNMADDEFDKPTLFSQDCFFFGLLSEGSYEKEKNKIVKVANVLQSANHIKKFIPSGIDTSLAILFYQYDEYIHNLVAGWKPKYQKHPYENKDGNLPPQNIESYLNEAHHPYKPLVNNYSTEPTSIGFVKFTVISAPEVVSSIKVKVKIDPWFVVYNWDKQFQLLNEKDSKQAQMPYNDWINALESDWNCYYRNEFVAIDEITSLVEAYGLLARFYDIRTADWKNLIRSVKKRRDIILNTKKKLQPELVKNILPDCVWKCKVIKGLGDKLPNLMEGNLAIALLMNEMELKRLKEEISCDNCSINEIYWMKDLESLAATNQILKAKLQLYKGIHKKIKNPTKHFKKSFQLIKNTNSSNFRLRAQTIYWITNFYLAPKLTYEISDTEKNNLRLLLRSEEASLINDFNIEINTLFEDKINNLAKLSRCFTDVYEGRLLQVAKDTFPTDSAARDYPIFKAFIEDIGKLHEEAASKLDLNSEVEMILLHAHFRYIHYLVDEFPEISELKNYRTNISMKFKPRG